MVVRTCRGWHRQASDECVLKSLRALFFSFLIVLCGFIYAAEVGEGRLWALGLVERTERPRSAAALLHPFPFASWPMGSPPRFLSISYSHGSWLRSGHPILPFPVCISSPVCRMIHPSLVLPATAIHPPHVNFADLLSVIKSVLSTKFISGFRRWVD
jgi:hypothetical protein